MSLGYRHGALPPMKLAPVKPSAPAPERAAPQGLALRVRRDGSDNPVLRARYMAARDLPGFDEAYMLALSNTDLGIMLAKVQEEVDRRSGRMPMPPVVQAIIIEAASRAGVSALLILSRVRLASVGQARMVAMASVYDLRTASGHRRFSQTKVGGFFGRDHSTVKHAVAKIAKENLIKP